MEKDKGLITKQPENLSPEMTVLCQNAIDLIQYARKVAAKQVNLVQLMTYYSLGRWIVEEQQQGENRAQYGKKVIKNLSAALAEQFGRGFSADTLENARKFYLNYQERISETVFRKFAVEKSEAVFRNLRKALRSFCHGRIICS